MIMNFKIAEHIFSVSLPEQLYGLLRAYRPFECAEEAVDCLFRVEVVEELSYEVSKTLLEDVDLSSEGMVRVNIYETSEGLLYNIIMPKSDIVNGQLLVSGEVAYIRLNRENDSRFFIEGAFTNAMLLSYITFSLPHDTLLLHASAVVKDGVANLFLGKSGTGKSTHSRMWLEAFPDAELLNDDHPVVRRMPSGEVVAFGSPWSGKTPCYRNVSAPVRSIVRIVRADYNRLTRLSPIRGYASVMTSCTAAQWSSELVEAKVRSLDSIISAVGCYQMECLPNNDAAVCCYKSICAEE